MCWILKPALVKNFGKAMQVQDDDGFVTISQAYSENTHQLIAEQAVILYHQIYGQWLSTQEIEWVKQGASREDTPPRWVNHFYDPTTGQGWNAQRMGQVPSSVLKLFSKISLSRQNPLSLLNWYTIKPCKINISYMKGIAHLTGRLLIILRAINNGHFSH